MKTIQNLPEYQDYQPLALTIGMFDGVHKGHCEIIKNLTVQAQKRNLKLGIFTFWPHPRKFLNPDTGLKLLNTLEEKITLLEKTEIDYIFIQKFDEPFRNLTGAEFVKQILVEKLNVRYLEVGYDHHFGKDRSGDFSLLQKMSGQFGFEVEQTQAVLDQHVAISSTKIREALQNGDIQTANEFLGYHYPIHGKVEKGKQIGRTIGFPTANIGADPDKLLPKDGAYIVETYIGDRFYKGMVSIGNNPTVNGQTKTIEVYILDFQEDIYGREITLRFRDFLHDEIKFKGLPELKQRLEDDERRTAQYEF